jgi:hypothetical protein
MGPPKPIRRNSLIQKVVKGDDSLKGKDLNIWQIGILVS